MNDYPYPEKHKKQFSQQDYIKSGSSMDCTGLIPSAPQNEYEYESYEELYSFLPPPPDENSNSDML